MDNLLKQHAILQKNESETRLQTFGNAVSAKKSVDFLKRREIEPNIHILMMFYVPRPDDYALNRIVAHYTRQKVYTTGGKCENVLYAHVEICFLFDEFGNEFKNHDSMGFSINTFQNLYMRFKSWKKEYRCIPVYMPLSKYKKLFHLCTQLAQNDVKFDQFGMYSSVLPMVPDYILRNRERIKHGTYCSKVIVECLQECDIGGPKIQALVPWRATPNLISVSLDQSSLGLVPDIVQKN